jgi:hypothetical protein
MQDAIAHAASQQLPYREEQANANEYVSKNFGYHNNYFLSFSPLNCFSVVVGLEGGKNPARKVLHLIQDPL